MPDHGQIAASHSSSMGSLRRVFYEGFVVRDIAEPLASFDSSTPAADVRRLMELGGLEVAGVRESGMVNGYVRKSELGDGPCGKYHHPFAQAAVVPDSASLQHAVLGLRDTSWLLVSALGHVAGIVTRSDLEKPPVRMWLFGMITLIEMRLAQLIRTVCVGDNWKDFLSRSRLEKAEELLRERKRRNQNVSLFDCLQFADKGQIVARNDSLRRLTRFSSRRQIEQVVKQLERLRNNLAHAQDLIATDWDTIALLAENLDDVLLGPPGLREASAEAPTRRASE